MRNSKKKTTQTGNAQERYKMQKGKNRKRKMQSNKEAKKQTTQKIMQTQKRKRGGNRCKATEAK